MSLPMLLALALAGTSPEEAISADLGDGIGIALVGILTVFFGLVTLTVLLPVLRRFADRGPAAEASSPADPVAESHNLTPAEVAAIGAAIHAHLSMQDQEESMELTWQDHDKPYTPWRFAGRAEHLSGLETVQSRIRSR